VFLDGSGRWSWCRDLIRTDIIIRRCHLLVSSNALNYSIVLNYLGPCYHIHYLPILLFNRFRIHNFINFLSSSYSPVCLSISQNAPLDFNNSLGVPIL
jgi:hypothetical protein